MKNIISHIAEMVTYLITGIDSNSFMTPKQWVTFANTYMDTVRVVTAIAYILIGIGIYVVGKWLIRKSIIHRKHVLSITEKS